MVIWRQQSLFPDLAFISRRKKIIRSGNKTYRTKKFGSTPLGLITFGQKASRAKVDRKRRAS